MTHDRRYLAGSVLGCLLIAGMAAAAWAQEDVTWPHEEEASTTSEEPAFTAGGDRRGEPESAWPPEAAEGDARDDDTAAPAETARPEAPVDAEGRRLVSMDFKDADIRQVLRVIALKSGVDIVAGSDVEGLVTIKLTEVPWEEALDIILRTYGFTYERKGDIVRVMTLEALEQEALVTRVFPLDYAKAAEVPEVLQEMLSDRGRVKFDERTNTVIVIDVPATLFQIKEVITRLDQRTPQVLIESRIVETKLEKDENLGIRWSDSLALTQTQNSFASTFPFKKGTTLASFGDLFLSTTSSERDGTTSLLSSNPTTTLGSVGIGTLSTSAMTMTLNILKQRSDTKIISNPTLIVLDNKEARIHIGDEFPVPTFSVDPSTGNTIVSGFEAKTVGTILTVTPHVNPSREIVVDLKPEVISVGANVSFDVGGGNSVSLPRFTTQTVTTQVRIQDRQTIAIGGLVKETEVMQENKVPVLGDLPLVGSLFRNTHTFGGSTSPTVQQDLLIFLTVKLTEESAKPQAVASTPEPER